MSITFAPRRGAILLCNFGPDPLEADTFPLRRPPVSVAPEIWKTRRVIVVSPNDLNHRHADRPGLCTVVPCSATRPRSPGEWDVPFAAHSYPSLTRAVWAKCAAIAVVSHARLDRVFTKRGYRSDFLSAADMSRLEAGLRASLGLSAEPDRAPVPR